jgi:lipid-binding SYLF domain-containing protein
MHGIRSADPALPFTKFQSRIIMKLKALTAVTGLTILGLVASGACFASTKAELRARADRTLEHFYRLNPTNKDLAGKATGILVFPRVTKGGVGIAGEYGEGVLKVNGATVSYYSVGSASVGLTLGVGRHSEIIMFMTPESLGRFQNSKGWSVGADTAVAVVSQGAGGQYDVATLDKPILGFVFGQKGLIGDLSLEGSKITKIKPTG